MRSACRERFRQRIRWNRQEVQTLLGLTIEGADMVALTATAVALSTGSAMTGAERATATESAITGPRVQGS
jgi:hypothetical protein